MAAAVKKAKQILRKEMKQVIKSLSDNTKSEQSEALCRKVLKLDVYKQSKRISIFLPLPDEVNTLPILQCMLSDGKECFIPQYNNDDMVMVRLNSWEEYQNLPKTSWGIKQPAEFDASMDSLHSGGLDLIFMPGLAFTKSGARLGRGKGYYDKYLKKCMDSGIMPKTVALIFNEQLIENIPVNENDVFVSSVLFPLCEI